MQTIILSEQDSDQRHAQRSSSSHVGNLFTGLLVGLCLIFLERRNQQVATRLPKPPKSWTQILLTYLAIALALFLLFNLLVGP